MADEKFTKVGSSLPEGDWRVAMRITGLGGTALGELHATTLRELMPGSYATARFVTLIENEGMLFAEFAIAPQTVGRKAVEDSAALLWLGMNSSEMLSETEDPDAKIDDSGQINPDQLIYTSYDYMAHDVSRDVHDHFHDFSIEPPQVGETPSVDLMAELEGFRAA